jgi:hypothetical protein
MGQWETFSSPPSGQLPRLISVPVEGFAIGRNVVFETAKGQWNLPLAG